MKTKLMMLMLVLLGVMASREAQAFYNPSTGRWLSRDPIGERGGFNLNAFAANNLVSRIDPDGRSLLASYFIWDLACFTVATARAKAEFATKDKKQHCMASCVYQRCKLLVTPQESLNGGLLWEIVMPGKFELGDYAADVYGVLTSYNVFKSCRRNCSQCPVK